MLLLRLSLGRGSDTLIFGVSEIEEVEILLGSVGNEVFVNDSVTFPVEFSHTWFIRIQSRKLRTIMISIWFAGPAT
jgi:hypothetical protein